MDATPEPIDLIGRLEELTQLGPAAQAAQVEPLGQIEPWVAIVIGVALCIGGWTLYRFGLRAVGFLLGAGVGLFLTQVAAHTADLMGRPFEAAWMPWIAIGCMLILGILNAWLFYRLYLVGVFFLTTVAAYALVQSMQNLEGVASIPYADTWYAAVGVAVVAGLAAVVLQRYIVILLTSLVGASLVAQGTGLAWILIPCLLAGVLVQLRLLSLFKIVPGLQRKKEREVNA